MVAVVDLVSIKVKQYLPISDLKANQNETNALEEIKHCYNEKCTESFISSWVRFVQLQIVPSGNFH